MSEKLVRLFSRMLYDIGRGYLPPKVKEFIKYIMSSEIDSDKKEEIVKKALQITIALKKSKSLDLLDSLANIAFKDYNIDLNRVKEFIKILAEYRKVEETRLRSIYLEALR